MLGDAKTSFFVRMRVGLYLLDSDALEGTIDGQKVIDYIANITDGGNLLSRKGLRNTT